MNQTQDDTIPEPVPPAQNLPSEVFKCPKNEHKLQTPWTIYYYSLRRNGGGSGGDHNTTNTNTQQTSSSTQHAGQGTSSSEQDKQGDESSTGKNKTSSSGSPKEKDAHQIIQGAGDIIPPSPRPEAGGANNNTSANSDVFRNFIAHLHTIGSFVSVESFWRHYCHLKRPSQIPEGCNIAVFRANLYPAWEAFPTGGCWIVRVKRNEGFLDRMWEELLLAAIGEEFLTPELVGITLAVRGNWVNLTVWNRDNQDSEVRFRIGERLKDLLNLDETSTLDYKQFQQALRDMSTCRNAVPYTYTPIDAATGRDANVNPYAKNIH